MPTNPRAAYDVKRVIKAVFDRDSWFEIKPTWAKNIVVGFARAGGHAVGVVANQPMQKGGILDSDSADKAARFIRMCDAFNVPLVYLMDVPGFIVGSQVEKEGIIRHGAKMLYATSEATVPKITVIMRKAYGAGYYVMRQDPANRCHVEPRRHVPAAQPTMTRSASRTARSRCIRSKAFGYERWAWSNSISKVRGRTQVAAASDRAGSYGHASRDPDRPLVSRAGLSPIPMLRWPSSTPFLPSKQIISWPSAQKPTRWPRRTTYRARSRRCSRSSSSVRRRPSEDDLAEFYLSKKMMTEATAEFAQAIKGIIRKRRSLSRFRRTTTRGTTTWKQAAAEYESALALAPNDPQLLFAAGRLYLLALKQPVKAQEKLSALVAANPTSSEALFWLGQAYAASKQWAQARDEFQRSFDIDHTYTSLFNLGLSFYNLEGLQAGARRLRRAARSSGQGPPRRPALVHPRRHAASVG